MMTSDQINALLDEIAATPGKIDKTNLVAANIADEQFQRVLVAALNPLVSYGVKQLPSISENGSAGEFNDGTWFLIDILAKRESTGHAARDAIEAEFNRLSIPSQTLLKRILTKRLGAGFDASTTNKAKKGLIPVFPYMRCSLPNEVKLDQFGWDDGVFSQEKADGMFINMDIDTFGVVRISSRQGTDFPMDAFEPLALAASNTFKHGFQLHGEMVVMKEGKIMAREDGNGVLNHVSAGGTFAPDEAPLFYVWDQIPLSAVKPKGKHEVGYKTRLVDIINQLKANPDPHFKLIPTKIVKSMKDAWAHYRELLLQGKEGTVCKKPTAIWKDGTSKEQIKLKLKVPVELRVKGFNPGSGKNEGKVGSLICHSECGELVTSVSCRGDKHRDDVTANPDNWLEAIVVVEGNAIMDPGESSDKHSLFLPIFVEKRTDKSEADDLGRIKVQFDNAIAAA